MAPTKSPIMDHSTETIVYFEGQYVPSSEALINVLSPAVTRGPLPYETLRAYWNEADQQLFIFRVKDHADRLRNSMRILRFRELFSEDELTNIFIELARRNDYREDIHYRVFVYPREQEKKQYATTVSGIVVEALPRPRKNVKPAKCMVSPWRRGGDDNQPARVKAMGIRLFARAAMDQAIQTGYDQLILLNERGKIAESVSSNLFLVRRGTVITPETTASILEGVTRDTLITLLKTEGMTVDAREVDLTEIYNCDEAFLCSTGLEILPIGSVDGLAINQGRTGRVTESLHKLYCQVIYGSASSYPEWRTPVYA